jgi:hypothetical protein
MALIIRRAVRPIVRLSNRNNAGVSLQFFSSFSMASQSIPVVLIGRTSEVGRLVTNALKPEYEGQSHPP